MARLHARLLRADTVVVSSSVRSQLGGTYIPNGIVVGHVRVTDVLASKAPRFERDG